MPVLQKRWILVAARGSKVSFENAEQKVHEPRVDKEQGAAGDGLDVCIEFTRRIKADEYVEWKRHPEAVRCIKQCSCLPVENRLKVRKPVAEERTLSLTDCSQSGKINALWLGPYRLPGCVSARLLEPSDIRLGNLRIKGTVRIGVWWSLWGMIGKCTIESGALQILQI